MENDKTEKIQDDYIIETDYIDDLKKLAKISGVTFYKYSANVLREHVRDKMKG